MVCVVNVTPRPLYPRERSGTQCIRGWVGPRAGLDGCRKSRPSTWIRSPDRPARSESLYRLSYPDPYIAVSNGFIGFFVFPVNCAFSGLLRYVNGIVVSKLMARCWRGCEEINWSCGKHCARATKHFSVRFKNIHND
jgi:hypothetical protein